MSKLTRICRVLAPEDVVRGAHVIVLSELTELVLPPCVEGQAEPRVEPVRVRWMAPDIEPLEVVDVCLPLIVARAVDGRVVCLDARRHALARLPRKVGRRLFARIREASKRR